MGGSAVGIIRYLKVTAKSFFQDEKIKLLPGI